MNLVSILNVVFQFALSVAQRPNFHVLKENGCSRSVVGGTPSANSSDLSSEHHRVAHPDRLHHRVHRDRISRLQQSDIILERNLVEVRMGDNLSEVVAFSTGGTVG